MIRSPSASAIETQWSFSSAKGVLEDRSRMTTVSDEKGAAEPFQLPLAPRPFVPGVDRALIRGRKGKK